MQGGRTTSNESRGRLRFIIGSTICVLLVTFVSAAIVLAYQMRLQRQTRELTDQVELGPRVLVEPISQAGSANPHFSPRKNAPPVTSC